MKTLFLIRHAKSSWKYPQLDDHDRPLNGRGERDRWRMAEYLLERETVIDAIHSSSAVRALSLATTLSKVLDVPVSSQSALYTFAARGLSAYIRRLPDRLDRAALVGHNPAITELTNHLTHAGLANVPTSGVVAIDCEVELWSELSPSVCSMRYFVAPKLI